MKHTTKSGIDLIKSFEGCRLTAYMDAVGVWTIGYGHTGSDVHVGLTISQKRAEALLKQDLKRFEAVVNKYEDIYHYYQKEFNALVSFAYNCGAGNFEKLTDHGRRTMPEIADKILLYNKAKGKELKGLTRRRQAERELLLEGMKKRV